MTDCVPKFYSFLVSRFLGDRLNSFAVTFSCNLSLTLCVRNTQHVSAVISLCHATTQRSPPKADPNLHFTRPTVVKNLIVILRKERSWTVVLWLSCCVNIQDEISRSSGFVFCMERCMDCSSVSVSYYHSHSLESSVNKLWNQFIPSFIYC